MPQATEPLSSTFPIVSLYILWSSCRLAPALRYNSPIYLHISEWDARLDSINCVVLCSDSLLLFVVSAGGAVVRAFRSSGLSDSVSPVSIQLSLQFTEQTIFCFCFHFSAYQISFSDHKKARCIIYLLPTPSFLALANFIHLYVDQYNRRDSNDNFHYPIP